ncbi:hypothetical protein WJX81_007501 [Elliptochloris bilobata]|uniref:GIY-YIG nuclease family protein n=1 Tax=Elliptochloris bilobata TaxID=381761 RepID=A0AAW1S4H4_9CHLO
MARILTGWGACPPCQQLSRESACRCRPAQAEAGTARKLAELDLVPFINLQGMIQPEVPEGTQASVFAVFDDKKKLQFVGFSKDVRNSLRTVFSRRPDRAFFFKALHLQTLDQDEMIAVRTAWFEEVGGPPPGNKLAMERKAWSQPVDAGAISDRGKQQAAEGEAAGLQAMMRTRGCKEDFVPNPELLQEGMVDFLASKALSPEELATQRERLQALTKATSVVGLDLDGERVSFELRFRNTYKTNGGYMFDAAVTFEDRETVHRVIVGREYYDDFGMEAQDVVAMAFSFLLAHRVPRQTEGMLLSSQFPVNYFSISELEQFFPAFADEYSKFDRSLEGAGKFWRFNRLHDYANKGKGTEDMSNLSLALNRVNG